MIYGHPFATDWCCEELEGPAYYYNFMADLVLVIWNLFEYTQSAPYLKELYKL